jgi:hypothetical protein
MKEEEFGHVAMPFQSGFSQRLWNDTSAVTTHSKTPTPAGIRPGINADIDTRAAYLRSPSLAIKAV